MSDSNQGKPEGRGAHAQERAEFWRIQLRTAQKWIQDGVPIDDPEAMIKWFTAQPSVSQAKFSAAFRQRIQELRSEREVTGGFVANQDYADFMRSRSERSEPASSLLAQLKTQADFAAFKLQRAQERGDLPSVKDATETLRHLSGVIHDEEVRAHRLNREIGDTIPRADAERFARANVYWQVRAVDELISMIVPKLAAASSGGALSREEVRKIVEPALLTERVLTPIARATQIRAGVSLPRWWYDANRDALGATIEDGPAEFDRLYSQPVAAPAA